MTKQPTTIREDHQSIAAGLAPGSRHKQQGISLIDLVLYLAVALALIGILFGIFRQVSGASNVVKASTNFTILASKVEDYYKSAATGYATLTDQVVIDANLAPGSMVDSPATLANAWGNAVTLASADITTGNDNAFTVTYTAVAADDCSGFVTKVEGGAVILTVAGAEVKNITGGGAGPLQLATLATSCAANADVPVDIIFTVR